MAWCEANRVDFVFGLAGNARLNKAVIPELITATVETIRTGRTPCCFKDFTYTTLDSWSRERRVIGKAEVTGGEANPLIVNARRGGHDGDRKASPKASAADSLQPGVGRFLCRTAGGQDARREIVDAEDPRGAAAAARPWPEPTGNR